MESHRVNSIISGRSPPLHCTPTLITMQGHQNRSRLVKAALYTRLFPDPRFFFLYSKILPVTKMRLDVCFNEMALYGPFAALIKGCSSYSRNESQPTREDD